MKKRGFQHIKLNYAPITCRVEKYEGRFLCKCVSSAVKFHDDISQKNDELQFFLDNFNVIYEYEGFRCSFLFNIMLHLVHEDNEKAAYLIFEMDLDSFNKEAFINTKNTVSQDYVNPEQIIFIKHLFYKNKMKLDIISENGRDITRTSLQDWCIGYIKKLCVAMKLDYENAIPNYVKDAAFKYSFIELKEIYDEKGRKLEPNFNDVNRGFLDKYAQLTYGLLLSDEGWRRTPLYIVKDKLQDYWSTRDFSCVFFLQHNALLFNLKNSKRGEACKMFGQKWFANYQNNKYKDYVSDFPCLTGIDTLTIFPFIKAIYKEINIDRYRNKGNKGKKNKGLRKLLGVIRWKNASKKIKNAREELEQLQEILNASSLNLGEIATMEKCIYKQFGIIEKNSQMKELYKQKAESLHFNYERASNRRIWRLTVLTAVLGGLTLWADEKSRAFLFQKIEKCEILIKKKYETIFKLDR